MNDNNRLSLLKKGFYCPQGLALRAPPWGWFPPAPRPRSASAPPCTTVVVVLIIFVLGAPEL